MTTDRPVPRSALGILASATATHRTGRPDDIELPRLPGFVESAFSPLAFEVARQCLAERPDGGTSRSWGSPRASEAERGGEAESGGDSRTAVVLAGLMGDTTTADLASSRMVAGRVHNPLLFMQATPNSVLGHMSREFRITGQMFSLSTLDDSLTELLAMADLLLEDPELDRVLVLGVELGGGERAAAVYRELAVDGHPLAGLPANAGIAAALLLARPGAGIPVTIRADETHDSATGTAACPGSIQGLFDLAATHSEARKETETHAHQ
ncbi:hypothetical protein [Streptomyces purpurascens]|uniref:hypothetical protein n=1 Tax=Streptomyces purpurascens TaxID=1924 RepID=UPI001672BA40|nr:hypothetical protein [Streptomyces purpurascens]MCE7046999.1 hypothetical protein [Streptomyces purpurascens]GHA03955.1 hypothetical protein GCM10010303_12060 [Streptomyces purpurascens]